MHKKVSHLPSTNLDQKKSFKREAKGAKKKYIITIIIIYSIVDL